MDWSRGLLECFSGLMMGMMARMEWLRGVETGFDKAGLAIALEK
jgi:hypothetical protein